MVYKFIGVENIIVVYFREIKLMRVGVGVGFMVFFLVYFILFCFI